MQRAEIFVDGEVQGVGYRYEVRRFARKHKLVGEVKNLEDGRVRIVCEGDEGDIKAFFEDINIKELPIFVENIEYKFSKATGEFKTFKIVPGELQEEMVEGFSTGMVYLRAVGEDVRSVGVDVRKVGEEVRGVREEVISTREELKGEIRGVKDEVFLTRGELADETRGLRSDLKSYLDERFARLEREVERIKAKMGIS